MMTKETKSKSIPVKNTGQFESRDPIDQSESARFNQDNDNHGVENPSRPDLAFLHSDALVV